MKATIQYVNALEEIQQATRDGKIKWIRNRPGSFKFKIINDDLEDLILSFQKIGSDFYLSLTKQDFDTSEILLNIDTSENDYDLKESLAELYELVEYNVDLANLEGLTKFINVVNSDSHRTKLFD